MNSRLTPTRVMDGMTIVELEIDESLLMPSPDTSMGTCCFVCQSKELSAILHRQLGRWGLCLKVFKEENADVTKAVWVRTPLAACTKAQNLFALHGVSPRVYAHAVVNEKYIAQVTDYLQPRQPFGCNIDDTQRVSTHLQTLVEQYQIETLAPNERDVDDIKKRNWRGDQFIDFGGIHFIDPDRYTHDLKIRAMRKIFSKGKGGETDYAYQAISELGIPGSRHLERRLEIMRLDKFDLQGKSVLDLGCNIGNFCHEAAKRGARRVVGVDREFNAKPAREIANWLGYWNVDFVGAKLPGGLAEIKKQSGIGQFDVVFCLAVLCHMKGYAPWLPALCKDTLFLEGHDKETQDTYQSLLERDFRTVEFLGYLHDKGTRPLFKCQK